MLERAITRAIEGGWKPLLASFVYDQGDLIFFDDYDETFIDVNAVIFNHDFAKALWGEKLWANPVVVSAEQYFSETPPETHLKAWQYHLQQMVIADDPIAYLGEHL